METKIGIQDQTKLSRGKGQYVNVGKIDSFPSAFGIMYRPQMDRVKPS
jgi:hypothetical protein